MYRLFSCSISLTFILMANVVAADEFNPAITKAMQSVQEAVEQAEADRTRPVFHFRPPANWMNDPNGTIYHDGYYHVFYQHNPYGDAWGHMHWGHTRSKDLIHWEHLPIALWPSLEQDEDHCFSGCLAINDEGVPLIFYTSVDSGGEGENRPNEQWIAIGDDDLLRWEKFEGNPFLSLDDHNGLNLGNGWRDPYIFEADGRTLMVIGGDADDEAVIPIYEATDSTLKNWEYKNVLYRVPKSDIEFFECPNFFELNGHWMLITSPYRPLEYFIGSFDTDELKFEPKNRGILDYGDPGFYASNTAFDDQGRCILFGWIRGFKENRGWNGCLALPRVLTIADDGTPRQQVVPEIEKLRGEHIGLNDLETRQLTKEEHSTLIHKHSMTFEMKVSLKLESETQFEIMLGGIIASDAPTENIIYDGTHFDIAGTKFPYEINENREISLHIFRDHSVLEVFIDDGIAACSRVIFPGGYGHAHEIRFSAKGGTAEITAFDLWEMKPIW